MALAVAMFVAAAIATSGLVGTPSVRGAEPDRMTSTPTPTPTATPTPTPTPTPPPGPTILGSSVTFYGRGFGHGVGMSQYGARGRALDGQDAAAILAHYYQGTTIEPLTPTPDIRVLVLTRWAASSTRPLTIFGRASDWSIPGIDAIFPSDAKLTLTPTTTTTASVAITAWRLVIRSVAGETLLDRASPPRFTIRGATDDARLQLWSKPGIHDRYRGMLRVIPASTGPAVSVVNRVPLEAYLRGVVPAEMPSSWPTEALRAQAIAARSYADRKLRPGVSYFDTYDDTRSQIYHGAIAERALTDQAIADTAGQVLRSGTTVANTMFHSTGGGATENNENVYTSATGGRIAGSVSYLRGSPDRRDDGSAYDEAAPYATWAMHPYKRSQLSAWFAADPRTDVGSLTALDLRRRGISGRLISVTLIGSKGKKTVSSAVFRSILNAARPSTDPMLRSTLFDTKPVP